MIHGRNREEISPGLVCVYGSAPEHHQQRSFETILDEMRNQLEGIITADFTDRDNMEDATNLLVGYAHRLQVSDCGEAYQSFCEGNMKLADEYISQRPGLIERFSKARARILIAIYDRDLHAGAGEADSFTREINRCYEEAKSVIEASRLNDDDTLHAQMTHLRLLHEVNVLYAPVAGHSLAPATLMKQLLDTEGQLRFASDAELYNETVALTRSVRSHWGFQNNKSPREVAMAVHPSAQHRRPTVIKIPSGHDNIEEAPTSERAGESARELGRLPNHVRAMKPRKRYL